MTSWGKINVAWKRIHGPSPFFRVGTYLVIFVSTEDWCIPSKAAVINDFGDLVEVPACCNSSP